MKNVSNDNTPNFLIVGAAKGGTTSLYYYLQQHPEVFLSIVKEPCFLCYAHQKPQYKVPKDVVYNIDDYKALFANSGDYKAKGEATAIYLYMYNQVIPNIKKYLDEKDNTKIVIILRDPVERAYSQYMMNVRDLREPLSFEDAIKEENKRKQENWNTDFFYLDRGLYYNQVKAYLDNFKHVKIYLFEELIADPGQLMENLCEFLEIKSGYKFTIENKFNVSGRPKFKFINKIIRADSFLKKAIVEILPPQKRQKLFESIKNGLYAFNLKKEKLNPEIKKQVRNYFKDDLIKLQTIIDKNISSWIDQ